MKSLIYYIILFLFSISCTAQIGRVHQADQLFEKFAFTKAVEIYQKAYQKKPENLYINQQLADCYMMLRKPEQALKHYKFIVENDDNIDANYYLMYAQSLRATGNYDDSKRWMKKYKRSGGVDDSRVKMFFKDPDYIDVLQQLKKQYAIENNKVLNTKNSDYGAISFNNEIYFISARNDFGKKDKEVYDWNNQPFLDIYKYNNETEKVSRISDSVNTKLHEGAVCFSPDGKYMYLTRSNFYKNKVRKDAKGTNNLKIYRSEKINKYWTEPKPLFFSSDNYSIGHPCMSSDGKKLFFTSDMPGGFGGTDIYMAEVHDRGGLKKPENLGSEINTEGNEMYPYFHLAENKLYFSSDGHPGMGLLDVFAAEYDGKQDYKNIVNLGEPVNSMSDDFSFYIDNAGNTGFISSNRAGGIGDDDIYEFKRVRDFILKGIVRDAVTLEPINQTKLILANKKGEIIFEILTNTDGYYEHIIKRNESYQLNADKPKYKNKIKAFDSFKQEEYAEMIINIELEPLHDMNVLAGIDANTIYFDYNRSTIRRDAEYELNKIIAVMHKYPKMIIRIESHTDSRGRREYNQDLSHRRAKSTYDYITNKGININRITSYKGFGEEKLTNNCGDNIKCSEEEHQKNRRTDFVIEKFK